MHTTNRWLAILALSAPVSGGAIELRLDLGTTVPAQRSNPAPVRLAVVTPRPLRMAGTPEQPFRPLAQLNPPAVAEPPPPVPAASAASSVQPLAPAASGVPAEPVLHALPDLLKLPRVLPLSPTRPDAVRLLTLPQSLGEGVAASLDAQAALARHRAFRYTADGARAALRPRLSLRVAGGRGYLESADPAVPSSRVNMALTLSQALFNAPQWLQIDRQNQLTESSRRQLRSAVSTAAVEVGASYLQALSAGVQVRLGAEHETALAELYNYMARRAEGGGASRADADRVRARVANARASIADARAALVAALSQLERLGVTDADAVELAGLPGQTLPASSDEALAEALARNDDLAAARNEVEAAELDRRAQKAAFLPRVDLELNRTRSLNAGGSAGTIVDNQVQVVLTVPLFNGGADIAQHRVAWARRDEKLAQAGNLERRLRQELRSAYDNLAALSQRYPAVREELSANRSVVTAYRDQLVNANRALLDVLDADQRYHQSRLDLLALAIQDMQARFKIWQLTGALAEVGSTLYDQLELPTDTLRELVGGLGEVR